MNSIRTGVLNKSHKSVEIHVVMIQNQMYFWLSGIDNILNRVWIGVDSVRVLR